MSKPHSSLSPTTNVLLIFVWAAVAAGCLFFLEPRARLILGAVGAVLGAAAGTMQHLSFLRATAGFSAASSLAEVRAAFKAPAWGARYIRFLYFSKFLLIVLVLIFVRRPINTLIFGYLSAYFSLMFVRELVTVRDTFFLSRLSPAV